MEWVLLSLCRAFFIAGKEVNTKLSLNHIKPSATISSFYVTIVSSVILLPYVLYDGSWKSIENTQFVIGICGNVTLNIFNYLLLMTVLKRFEVSYVAAILATSPLIYSIASNLFLEDTASLYAIICMSIIAFGGVFIELSNQEKIFTRDFFKKSAWLPLILYLFGTAGATVFSKTAVMNGDPEAYIALRYTCLGVLFFIFHHIYESKWGHKIIKRNRDTIPMRVDRQAIFAGFFIMCAVLCEMRALQLTNIAYVEAISKLSIVFVLTVDTFFIKKHFNPKRWIGAILILLGGMGMILV